MKTRQPQLALRLDAATPDAAAIWRAGGAIVCRGGVLTLTLDTTCRLPERIGDELHLPLPPAATAQQIRDAAESWLRDEALRFFTAVCQKSLAAGNSRGAPAGNSTARIVLTFGKRGDWVKREGDVLRCHWRLIEQTDATILQVLGRACGEMAAETAQAGLSNDLFAFT